MSDNRGIAWVDGKITSMEEAKIPFLDRGYFLVMEFMKQSRSWKGSSLRWRNI